MLTVTRARRAGYTVQPMDPPERPPYPADLFAEKFESIREWIESGAGTPEQAIARLQQTGALSDEQRKQIRGIKPEETEE